MPLFGAAAYDPANERPDDVPIEEQLRGLEAVIKAGKVQGGMAAGGRGGVWWGRGGGLELGHHLEHDLNTQLMMSCTDVVVCLEMVPERCCHLLLAGYVQVRYIGVSNETSWGVSEFCRLASEAGLPKIQTIQNCYHLNARVAFETDLAEMCRWVLVAGGTCMLGAQVEELHTTNDKEAPGGNCST